MDECSVDAAAAASVVEGSVDSNPSREPFKVIVSSMSTDVGFSGSNLWPAFPTEKVEELEYGRIVQPKVNKVTPKPAWDPFLAA